MSALSSLDPSQLACYNDLLTLGKHLLFLATGFGKTRLSLAYAEEKYLKLGLRVVVVCPKCVINVWVQEAKVLFASEYPNFEVINYDIISTKLFTSVSPALIIFDECTSIKNASSSRVKFLVAKSKVSRATPIDSLFLTATPFSEGFESLFIFGLLHENFAGRRVSGLFSKFSEFMSLLGTGRIIHIPSGTRTIYESSDAVGVALLGRYGHLISVFRLKHNFPPVGGRFVVAESFRAKDYFLSSETFYVGYTLPDNFESLYSNLSSKMYSSWADSKLSVESASVAKMKRCHFISSGDMYEDSGSTKYGDVFFKAKISRLPLLLRGLSLLRARISADVKYSLSFPEISTMIIVYNYVNELASLIKYIKDNDLGKVLVFSSDKSFSLAPFRTGGVRFLLMSARSTAFGVNLQDCCFTILWFSLPLSYERFEQMNARILRRGQRFPVTIAIMLSNRRHEIREYISAYKVKMRRNNVLGLLSRMYYIKLLKKLYKSFRSVEEGLNTNDSKTFEIQSLCLSTLAGIRHKRRRYFQRQA